MRTFLICCLAAITLNGCAFLTNNARVFEYSDQTVLFYDGYSPDSGGMILTDGLYLRYDSLTSCFKQDNEESGLLFYSDGTATGISCDMDETSMIDVASIRYSCAGGIYTISGDTLIVDEYKNDPFVSWDLVRAEYKILSDGILKLLSKTYFTTKVYSYWVDYSQKDVYYRFVALPSELPRSFEAKVKKRKWMWTNETDWEDYKQKVKEWEESGKHWFRP